MEGMKNMIVIKGGTVVTVAGETIQDGMVLVEGDKIAAVGRGLPIPEGAAVTDASGCWVTPGLIDAHTHISVYNEPQTFPGLMGDGNEFSDPITAHIRGLDAFDPCDMAITAVREAGFTTCYTGPGSANVIGGTGIGFKPKKSANPADLVIPGCVHMKMAMGENPKRCYGLDGKLPMTRMGAVALLRETLSKARHYSDELLAAERDGKEPPKPDFKLDALVPVVRGEMRVRAHCHRADDIQSIIRVAEEFGLDLSLEHVTEGYKILDVLQEKKLPCVVGPLLMDPGKVEVWGCRQDTPARMEEAGIEFCLTADDHSATRFLPAHVGLCIARGLSLEGAFRSVTINAAKVLQLDHRLGTLEPGKDADIAVFSGMPFENRSRCLGTMIDGVWEKPFAPIC